MPWGAAIGAVGALGAAAINKSGQTSTGGSTTANSPETIAATNQALTAGQNIANRPYTPYTGQVVAGETAEQQQATAMGSPDSAANTKASSLLDQAAGDISGIKQYNTSNLQSYMDPYVSSVLTPQLNAENVNYGAQKSALDNNKAGAFGGDRSALADQSLNYTHGQQIASDVGNAYSNAYTNAQSAFFNDQNKQINAANALNATAGDVSKLNEQQVQDLMASGGLKQALQQSQLDFNYNQFVENRDWSVSNLQPLLNSIATAKGTQTTTNTYSGPNSAAGAAIGAAATVAGAYFTGGKSTAPSGNSTPTQIATTPGFSSVASDGTPDVTNQDSGTTTYFGD